MIITVYTLVCSIGSALLTKRVANVDYKQDKLEGIYNTLNMATSPVSLSGDIFGALFAYSMSVSSALIALSGTASAVRYLRSRIIIVRGAHLRSEITHDTHFVVVLLMLCR